MDSRAMVAAILFLLFGALILAAFISIFSDSLREPGFQPATLDFGPVEGECVSGSTAKCTDSHGCPGSKTCLHGKWSPCYAPVECTPGDKRFCSTGSCANGIQTCNSCSQWGPCISQ